MVLAAWVWARGGALGQTTPAKHSPAHIEPHKITCLQQAWQQPRPAGTKNTKHQSHKVAVSSLVTHAVTQPALSRRLPRPHPDQLLAVAAPLADDAAGADVEEGGGALRGHSLGQQRLACPRGAIQQDALPRRQQAWCMAGSGWGIATGSHTRLRLTNTKTRDACQAQSVPRAGTCPQQLLPPTNMLTVAALTDAASMCWPAPHQ
jgi:hypothetical protein